VRTLDDLSSVIAFFEARRGRLYGFRFADFTDRKSCTPAATPAPGDQPIGTGNGAATVFQLIKTYSSGTASWSRAIVKPVTGSVRLAVGGVETTAFTLDAGTGLVTFAAAPAADTTITAGFLFDTPVRFDSDVLSVNLASFAAGEIPSIPLVEILL
jgi:uncharacterized protein (TIGR02217 family)